MKTFAKILLLAMAVGLVPLEVVEACTIVDKNGKTIPRAHCDPESQRIEEYGSIIILNGAFLPVRHGFVFVNLTRNGFVPRSTYDTFYYNYIGYGCTGPAYLPSDMLNKGSMWERAAYVDGEKIYFPSMAPNVAVDYNLIGSAFYPLYDECYDFEPYSGFSGYSMVPMVTHRLSLFGYVPPFKIK